MYLVYQNISGDIYSVCVCSTASDAEEMCLELAWDAYYTRAYIDSQIAIPNGYNSTYAQTPTLLNSSCYKYKEVPYIV